MIRAGESVVVAVVVGIEAVVAIVVSSDLW